MSVFVLDRSGKPLMPCTEKRARKLLESGRARVHRMRPFAIRLTDRRVEDSTLQPLALKIDPGSKATGIAVCRMQPSIDPATGEIEAPVMHIAHLQELVHRGQAIRDGLQRRAAFRRRRRGANLRYRAPRFENRTRPAGWLAPSLQHRVDTTKSWVRRLRALAPITSLSMELVRFDMHQMQAESDGRTIEGVEYQQGTLAGYEVGEYLLAKWGRQCAYCDAKDGPLEKDHILAKNKGGSDRVSNLTLACRPCNQRKDNLDVKDFLVGQPDRLRRILAQAKAPLKDAAAVNSTRWRLFEQLSCGLPLQTGSGGLTKFNRTRLCIPKSHALDAACVGCLSDVRGAAQPTLAVKCTGRGSRSRTRLDSFGFPRGYLMVGKSVNGFRTGDLARATVPSSSKKAGVYTGRVAVRASGRFNIQTGAGVVQGISHKHCKVLMRADGYGYSFQAIVQPGKCADSNDADSFPARSGSFAARALTRPNELVGVYSSGF